MPRILGNRYGSVVGYGTDSAVWHMQDQYYFNRKTIQDLNTVQVTITTQANSSWDSSGITLYDGTNSVSIVNGGSTAPTDGSYIIPQSASLFNTCLQTSTGNIGVGRGSSWGRVDIYFASPISLKVYGSGSGNGGTGCFVEYSNNTTQLVSSASDEDDVIRVYAYHQSGVGGASITQMCKQDGTALFTESGTIDTNRLLAIQ